MAQAPDTSYLAELRSFGDSLMVETRDLILSLWNRSSVHSELKDDQSPVSEVDLRCEELVRQAIMRRFPTHGIIGEEFGSHNEASDFVWTIDPIDGTLNLINRIPTFGTILGLLYRGEPLMGWIDHPVLGESLTGGAVTGTFANGAKVSLVDLAGPTLTPNDVIGTNCPATFARGGNLESLNRVLAFHPHSRIYYDVYAHSLTIRGSLAVMVEYNLKIWDLSATKALIEGAGGTYTQLGATTSENGLTVYHAAFGKKRAVELLAKALA